MLQFFAFTGVVQYVVDSFHVKGVAASTYDFWYFFLQLSSRLQKNIFQLRLSTTCHIL